MTTVEQATEVASTAEVPALWNVDVAGVDVTPGASMMVVERDLVLAVFDGDSGVPATSDGAQLIALDASTGTERWRRELGSEAAAFAMLGVLDGVVVIEQVDTETRSLLGIDAVTGRELWRSSSRDPGVHVVIEGAAVVTRVSFTVNARLTVIEPSTGEEVGRVPGRLFATDFLGRWYVRNGSRVVSLDLSDGWSVPVEVARPVDPGAVATVIDDRIVVVAESGSETDGAADGEDDGAADGEDDGEDDGEGGDDFLTLLDTDGLQVPLVVDESGVALPSEILRLSAATGSRFAFTGPSAVYGGVLGEQNIRVDWSREGAVLATSPTERGLALVVGRDGDPTRHVIDGSSGSVIATIDDANIGQLVLAGNGVIRTRAAALGSERVAFDLDGEELWTLIGDGPLAVGDGLVVGFSRGNVGVRLVAFGDET